MVLMGMARLRTRRNLRLSDDSNETTQIFEKIQEADELTDAFTSGVTVGPRSLAPLAALVVNFQGLTNVKFVYVECDNEVQLTINGSATPLKVTPRPNTDKVPTNLKGRMELWTEGVTSLTVTNASATLTARITVVLAGS